MTRTLTCLAALPLTLWLGGCHDDTLGQRSERGGGGLAGGGGAAGAGGGAPSGGQGGSGERTLLIDDCDDGDHVNRLGGIWGSYDDRHDPAHGESVVSPNSVIGGGVFEMTAPGFGGGGHAARITGTTATKLGYDYVGLLVALGPNSYCPDPQPPDLDLESYVGIRFRAKGRSSGGKLTLKILHSKDGAAGNCTQNGLTGDTLTNWADYAATFTDELTEDWTEISLDFRRDFVGGIGADLETVLDHAKDFHFFFQSSAGGTVDLTVDDLELYGDASKEVVTPPPDMELQPAEPPAKDALPSLVIDHPLAALAAASLSKGYNITNWLEQEDFAGFTYDEAFVTKLAATGHRALRLPIDFDRYITNYSAYSAGAPLALDPKFFEILDAFEGWTRAHGLSLTIDFHQYDASFDLADPIYLAAVQEMWGRVAEHFATNRRPDLFFELLNEVEQSSGTTTVEAASLTTFATQTIAAIRRHDASRVLLFGDVGWYGISSLTQRTPFADPNIIYVFHFYEPFLFTHQGTSWTELATVHGVPYPYAPDRWFEHYADLGLNPLKQPAWVISSAREYYRTGNRNSLYNQVAKAKRWAVDHRVPIICNEFGAWDGTSASGDRVAYYSDLVSVFDELEIPWSHWFMLMDRNSGKIDPELAKALGLTTP